MAATRVPVMGLGKSAVPGGRIPTVKPGKDPTFDATTRPGLATGPLTPRVLGAAARREAFRAAAKKYTSPPGSPPKERK